MADQHQSVMKFYLGDKQFPYSTPLDRNTPLNRLKEIAAKTCGVSQPIILEHRDRFFSWTVVREGYKLRHKERFRVTEKVRDQLL